MLNFRGFALKRQCDRQETDFVKTPSLIHHKLSHSNSPAVCALMISRDC